MHNVTMSLGHVMPAHMKPCIIIILSQCASDQLSDPDFSLSSSDGNKTSSHSLAWRLHSPCYKSIDQNRTKKCHNVSTEVVDSPWKLGQRKREQIVQKALCHSFVHKSNRQWSCPSWRHRQWARRQSSAAPSNRELPVTAVRLRICHCGSLCRVVQDGWITGDILTLQFGVLPWAHVTGWTNSPRISSSCLFHPDIQFSATRSHWSSHAAKRARGAQDRGRYYKH